MSVKRLILDSGVLDQDRIIGTGTIVLDSRAVLDTNIISSTGYIGSTTYNDNLTLYNGSKIVYDYADSNLGSLSSIAQSIPQVIITANASLGNLNSQTISNVIHNSNASSSLGSLSSSANTLPIILPILESLLGSLSSSASSSVIKNASANSSLGTLNSSAISQVKQLPVANSLLGSLSSNANSTIIPPTPPEPSHGGGSAPYRIYKKKKPEFIDVVEEEVIEIPIKVISASASFNSVGLSANAQTNIQWSILDDEAEILMLLGS